MLFQHTHQPEGRCDPPTCSSATTASRFQHTHQPEGRCDPPTRVEVVQQTWFQHTHQPEGRCDPCEINVCDSHNQGFNTRTSPKAGATRRGSAGDGVGVVSTHAPARRPVRPGLVGNIAIPKVFQHTHQPEGRCDSARPTARTRVTGFNTRTSPKAGATLTLEAPSLGFKFQHTHQPEGRCDPCRCLLVPGCACFNTRTSPKAGATAADVAGAHRAQVSTHAPARRPVRPPLLAVNTICAVFQHTHQPEGRCDRPRPWPRWPACCFNTRTSPKAGATVLLEILEGWDEQFQHTHQPEGRCDALRSAGRASSAMFQHTHQPEGRCDIVGLANVIGPV